MDMKINEAVVTLSSTGRLSKGGKEIFEAKGVTLQDGTLLYITAYKFTEAGKAAYEGKKAEAKLSKKAAKDAELSAMIAAAVANALGNTAKQG